MYLVPNPPAAVAPCRDVLDTLHGLGRCRTLLHLLAASGFAEDFTGDVPPLTIFAPTDAAFAALGGAAALLDPDHEEQLFDLLEYHLVRGRLELGAAIDAGSARSIHGAEIHFSSENGVVRADAARVRGSGISCTNGVVYVVDRVLSPALSEAKIWLAELAGEQAEPRPWLARSALRGGDAPIHLLPA